MVLVVVAVDSPCALSALVSCFPTKMQFHKVLLIQSLGESLCAHSKRLDCDERLM